MKIINSIKRLRHKTLIKLYSSLPIQKNKIIIWSNSFKSYGCNPKYISEYISRNYPTQFDIVWVFDASLPIPDGIPDGVRIVRYFSKEYLYELHTAHYVICNARTSDSYFWNKRKGQIYIQTWHSSIRLKTIEKDAEDFLPDAYIYAAKKDSEKIDFIISGCEFSSNIFKNSFWYNGKVLECGTPRIDFLLNQENKSDILKKIGLSDKHKYILYSPTFRTDKSYNYNFDFSRLISACKDRFGGEWRVLYRLHPNLIYHLEDDNSSDICIDVCKYSDMQELIAVSDIMITDYSSCMFDMMYINKPCILYMPDYNQYTTGERKLYFDIQELPFPKSYTEDELFNAVDSYNDDEYQNTIAHFMHKIGSYETGNACQSIADLIIKKREIL